MNTQTFNVTDIWKETRNIGSTTHTNVADGTTRVVPWGAVDWIAELMAWGAVGAIIYFILRYTLKF